jgi:hypothetical protein
LGEAFYLRWLDEQPEADALLMPFLLTARISARQQRGK